MTVMASVQEKYDQTRQRVAEAAQRSGRREQDVVLVAVTKYAELDQIKALVELGHLDLAENQVQQLLQRAAAVDEYLERLRVLKGTLEQRASEGAGPLAAGGETPRGVRWHMIGHLQRNKARKALDVCRLIHSCESLRLAEEVQAVGLQRDCMYELLIQVNASGEASKGGCPVPAVIALAEQIETMANVRLRGLMTMAPYSEDPGASRPVFARTRELLEEMRRTGAVGSHCNILSMGMTHDFEVAIEEGANIVRVGSAIFGERE